MGNGRKEYHLSLPAKSNYNRWNDKILTHSNIKYVKDFDQLIKMEPLDGKTESKRMRVKKSLYKPPGKAFQNKKER